MLGLSGNENSRQLLHDVQKYGWIENNIDLTLVMFEKWHFVLFLTLVTNSTDSR